MSLEGDSSSEEKYFKRPNYKVFAVRVDFPANTDGISVLQVSVEVVGTDTSSGERFAEALNYANTGTTASRHPIATNNST
jgi:hypothetical protein